MPTFYVKNPKFKRDDFLKFMSNKNIALRPCFYPLHQFKFYKSKNNSADYKYSKLISKNGVNLPSYYELDVKDLQHVINQILKYFRIKKLNNDNCMFPRL